MIRRSPKAKNAHVTGIIKAFAAGKQAARDGKTLGANPYARCDYRLSWIDGWHDAVNVKNGLPRRDQEMAEKRSRRAGS